MKFILSTLLLFSSYAFSQGFENNFEKYDRHRVAPFGTTWHEINTYQVLTFDLDYKESYKGNFGTGINYGIGLGYMFNFGIDDMPQSIGVGLNAEIHPKRYTKTSLGFKHKVLSLGTEFMNASFLGSEEINLVFDYQSDQKEMNVIIYLLEAQYKSFTLKYGLQSWWDKIIPSQYFDDSFTILKLSYEYDFK